MRAVIDTNVIVSAVFFKGNPRAILDKLSDNKFELICSQKIIEEYVRVIDYFAKKYDKELGNFSASFIIESATIIKVSHYGKYCRDPNDDKFINCARTANAKYIVSGDKDLLVLNKIEDIEIVTPKEFLSKI
jgi:putative PIN family toxin of toxin-antitoxin system